MKKILAVLSIAILITSCQKQKIGYVDNGKVINEMQEKVDLEKKYETKLNAFNAKKDSIGRAFQMEAQKFQMEAQKMSQSKAQAKYEELGQKVSSLVELIFGFCLRCQKRSNSRNVDIIMKFIE